MSRRAPRWATEGVAWTAALVLFAGVAVVATGVINPRDPKALAVETPVVSSTPAVIVKPTPKPAAVKKPGVTNRARTLVPRQVSLGPPPGPQYDPVPSTFAAPERRYAFLVGVTRYRKPTHDTIAGANDVVFIRSMLIAAGWLPQNIRMVTNEGATGANVRAGLAWLAGRSFPGTFTLFHFSGHVKQTGGHEKLWPYDRDFVNDTEMASVLGRGTGKMWIDIAGCEAGGFMEGLPSSRVLVSASSKASQKSYEYPQWGESVWSGLLYDLGLGQGQADADHNGTTTVGEALRYATYYAQAITLNERPYGRQTPQVAGDPVRGWTLENPPA
ncbi:MAG TPA: caspase family protein [Nonomuraea sp.]|nr:caspase family protein [Nonomuraea sp.]